MPAGVRVTAAHPIFQVEAFGVKVIVFENVTFPVVVILLFITRVPVNPVQLTTVQADATSMVIVLFPVVAVSIAVSPAIGWALVAAPPSDKDQVELLADQFPDAIA